MNPSVLVLEDNRPVLDLVVLHLAGRGLTVVGCATVAQALAAYEPDRFDVIVVDYQLPDGTGLDLLAAVRGSDKAATVVFSSLDRSREIAASGLHVDHALPKERLPELLDLVCALAQPPAGEGRPATRTSDAGGASVPGGQGRSSRAVGGAG